MQIDFARYHHTLKKINPINVHGRVIKVVGLVIEGHGLEASIGEECEVFQKDGEEPLLAEVVGFSEGKVLLMPLGEIRGIGPGDRIMPRRTKATVGVGESLLGRVIDGLGVPVDDKGPVMKTDEYPLYKPVLNPLERRRIQHPLDVGIRAINGLDTIGKGQKMGIFAGSGVGKSVLLGMMARYTEADVNVIALIGERGREIKEFLEKDLLEDGLKHSVVIVATSDQPPLVRIRGAYTAMAIAEYFRDQGKEVLFMMDSVTRFAMAMREVGLVIGEPPTTKGYPPSVFAMLPKLIERAGTSSHEGTITGIFTVLVEGDDLNDPVPDALRSILDGHIVLSRDLFSQGHYPAIDATQSTSRVMIDVVSDKHKEYARKFKRVLATYQKNYDLINIGAYKKGSDPDIDDAISKMNMVNTFLRQEIEEKVDFDDSLQGLYSIFGNN